MLHLAMLLLISNEMIAPPKPMISEKPASAVMFRPFCVRKRSTPKMRAVTISTAITAKLVKTKSSMRFMCTPDKKNGFLIRQDFERQRRQGFPSCQASCRDITGIYGINASIFQEHHAEDFARRLALNTWVSA